MKNIISCMALVFLCVSVSSIQAQGTSTSIGSSLGLYVFPAKNQDAQTQDADETDCYKWAQGQTGYNPMNPTKATAAQVDTSPDGSAVRGAAGGAAAGAAIGAIAGNAGEGAAIGAIVGGLRGRRSQKMGDSMQQQANDQAAAQKNQQMADDFNKAFSACMEAKGYTVK